MKKWQEKMEAISVWLWVRPCSPLIGGTLVCLQPWHQTTTSHMSKWVTTWLAQVHLAALTAPLRWVATVLLACVPWANLSWEAAWVQALDHQGTAFGWKGCCFQQVEAIASLMSVSSSLAACSTSFLVSLGEGWI